jgi:hypothetical protein
MTVFRGYGPGDRYTGRPTIPGPWDKPQAYHATQLDRMPDLQFFDLAKRVQVEAQRRVKPIQAAYYTAFDNFLTGAAHAMACRAALRWSKGMIPYYTPNSGSLAGKTPTSGEMWKANEGADCAHRVSMGISHSPKALLRDPLVMSGEGFRETFGSKFKARLFS